MKPKISVVMAHWNRKDLLQSCVDRMLDLYHDFSIEIVVCDDGSKKEEIPDIPGIKLLRSEEHTAPRNPALSINRAVKESNADIIALTNPEVFHITPVLLEAVAKLDPQDDVTYLASKVLHCDKMISKQVIDGEFPIRFDNFNIEIDQSMLEKSDDYQGCNNVRWTSHPNHAVKPYHNLGVFSRKLWDRIGGLDEEFMKGLGWEDEDLIAKLESCDVQWLWGAVAHLWHNELYLGEEENKRQKINREYYESKWGEFVAVD